jgi:hypothetical protein
MKQIYALLITTLFLGCSSIQLNVDYDTQFNFTGKTKYSIAHNEKNNSLTDKRVKNALQKVLKSKNYTSVPKKDADLVFVFHTNVKDKTDISMDYEAIGYGGFGYRSASRRGVIAVPDVYNYTEGTLVIDAYNPKTKNIVWRGIASDELGSQSSSPEEKTAYINNVVETIMKKFPN